MSISNHHPVELDFDKEIHMIRVLVESFEKKVESGVDKYELLLGLKDLRDRIYDLQLLKFGYYLDKDSKPENVTVQEEIIIVQIFDLENRIDSMMSEV